MKLTEQLELIVGHNPRFPSLVCTNCLLIRDEVTALVDSGAGAALLPLARRGGVDRLLHTHLHLDHTNFGYLFPAAAVSVPVYMAEAFSNRRRFSAYSGFDALGPIEAEFCLREYGYSERAYHDTLADGDRIDLGRTRLRFLHAPGHSADHMIVHFEDLDIVLSTDLDMSNFGPFYGNPGSDIDLVLDSIRLIEELRPRMVISSHLPEPVTADIPARLARFAAQIERREERIWNLLTEPRTLAELVAAHPIYRSYIHPEVAMYGFEAVMIEKHLDRLAAAGRVEPAAGRWQRRGG